MSSNNIKGAVPPCFIGAPALEELYLSVNQITGPLPDVFNSSKLSVFYALMQKGRTLTGGCTHAG